MSPPEENGEVLRRGKWKPLKSHPGVKLKRFTQRSMDKDILFFAQLHKAEDLTLEVPSSAHHPVTFLLPGGFPDKPLPSCTQLQFPEPGLCLGSHSLHAPALNTLQNTRPGLTLQLGSLLSIQFFPA